MRTLASARQWPPDYLDELADLLIQVPYPHIKPSRRRDTEYALLTALAEIRTWLEAWLNDQQLASDTQSMVDDVARAFAGLGPKVCSRTPSVIALQQVIRTVVAARGQADARPAIKHLAALHAELTHSETILAAFDDLVATVRDPNNSHLVVQTRLAVFTEILDLADRPAAEICRILGGIVDDQALEISIARHGLDGTPILNVDRPDEQAGLSVRDRLELSRRYLSVPARPGRHLVWVAYGDADLAGDELRAVVGPVQFFDGPALLEAIGQGEVSQHRLPEELLDPRGPGGRDLNLWPAGGEIRRWVAARVDLGTGQFSDPIRIGRAQADAIVQLAAFENGESTWQPLAGVLHLVDGRHHSSERFRLPDDFHDLLVDRDETARAFPEVASTVGTRVPVVDPVLGRLLRELSTLNASTRSAEPDMAADIRVIEVVTRQNQSPYWPDFLKDNIAVHHARNRAIREIYQSVLGVLDAMVFDNEGRLERRIREFLPDGRMLMNRKAALDLIPELMVGLPDHHIAARRLREVARRVEDLAQLKAWIDELAADYRIRISRAARFRNGFTHGGGAAPEVAATVRLLINAEARLAAGTALAALVEGQPIKQAFIYTGPGTESGAGTSWPPPTLPTHCSTRHPRKIDKLMTRSGVA